MTVLNAETSQEKQQRGKTKTTSQQFFFIRGSTGNKTTAVQQGVNFNNLPDEPDFIHIPSTSHPISSNSHISQPTAESLIGRTADRRQSSWVTHSGIFEGSSRKRWKQQKQQRRGMLFAPLLFRFTCWVAHVEVGPPPKRHPRNRGQGLSKCLFPLHT